MGVHDIRLEAGDDGMGSHNAMVNIGNDGTGSRDLVTNGRNCYVRIYRKLGLGANS
jgi:hypothetical protein